VGIFALFAAVFLCSVSGFAQTGPLKTTISDIQNDPDKFYEQEVEVPAYFLKTDDIWVRSLDQPDQYIGVFVSKSEKGGISPIIGEYFGFIFAPRQLEAQVHYLKMGDKITIRGKCFKFKSISIETPGIKVSELLSGWGETAKPATASLPVTKDEVVALIKENTVATASPETSTASSSQKNQANKYDLYLNGKEYQGLSFGDEYTFEGIRFRVVK
jgi:hypothetical protein